MKRKNVQKTQLSKEERESLLRILKDRFEQNPHRHKGIKWAEVAERLTTSPKILWSIAEMERTDGEPDIIGRDKKTGEYIFVDCAAESPKGRRSLCYDERALDSRKEHKPAGSAIGMAGAMGIELLTEAEYRTLQKHGAFDQKTSSWIKTPNEIRKLGDALFCDRRFDHIFVYHNGVESYYAGRGFRWSVRV